LKQASAAWHDFSEDTLSKAIDVALQALDIEPDYAAAHGIVSHLYADLTIVRPDLSDELLPKARAAAEEALRLDPNEGSAHNRLGLFHMAGGDWTGAEARYQIAIQASPSHASVRFCYGRLLLFQGWLDKAAVQFHKAFDLEPLSPLANDGLAYLHLAKGEYDEAIRVFRRILELDPGNWSATWELPLAHHLNGTDDEALSATLRWASDSSQAPPDLEPTLRRGFDEGGWAGMHRALAAERVARTGEPCPDLPPPLLEAHTYARAGEPDPMFACLEKLVGGSDLHPSGIRNLRHHPVWAPYRDDPRFTALLERLNLVE
jgi:tetratricopeptide (TPR) repeat protein